MVQDPHMPRGHTDTQGLLSPDSFLDEAFRGEYVGTDLKYKGFARPGTATSAPFWQIALLEYDVSHNIISITWPVNLKGASSNFYEFIWDDRASYTYL